jgi:hypothetical protein
VVTEAAHHQAGMSDSEYQYFGAEIAKNRADARLAQKKRYRRLLGWGFGGAGLAAQFAGLPLVVSLALWGLGLAAWTYLKAI